MKYLVIFALLSIVFLSTTFVPSASSQAMCAGDKTLEEQYQEYDYIFSGKVSEIQPNPVRGKITLTVYEMWKGQPSESITILSGVGESDYSIPFELYDNYLVFASKLVFDEPVTSGCSPTKPLINASNEIEFLNTKTESQTVNFRYPVPGGSIIASLYSLKTQIESNLSYDQLRCNEGHVLIKKYDGTPACVTESTKQKLIERGWTGTVYTTPFGYTPSVNHKTVEPIQWKKYITVSATQNDDPEFAQVLPDYKISDISDYDILQSLLVGADGCKTETEVCRISNGISLDRSYPFIPSGKSISNNDQYTITIDKIQAENILSKLDWQREGDSFYSIVYWGEKQYFLVLSTFDHKKTPDVKMDVLGTTTQPIALQKGNTLNYTIIVTAWSTYGADAQIELDARKTSTDSGISAWIEPSTFFIKERSNATATLFIHAKDNARDGIYDVRVTGQANGKNANLHCSGASCPAIRIGDSEWSIHNFGSNSGRGIGSGQAPQNTWMELELNKDTFFEGDTVEINAYLVNNGTKKIEFVPRELLISVIKAEPVGYYENLYGIDARYESDKPITLEPDSKTSLVRTFYWNQTTFHDIDDQQRLEPKQYKMIARFVGENYTWDDDLWFEIK